ncbi:MAG: M14 family murein peptide amidase A [Azonexaceae bacterium]|nr:M14 family murein peptide amidase A [Azonexaceae bacterium]
MRLPFFILACLLARPVLADPLIHTWCHELDQRLRSVSGEQCRRQGFVADPTVRTPGGRALVWHDVAPRGREPDKAPHVLVIGGIHGDELTSISVVFRWLQWIKDPAAGNYHWRIVPLVNPDGLMLRPPTRANANGVDLNRNFPTPDWDKDAEKYWVDRTKRDPRRFPGKAAGSEIETQWLVKQIDAFQPDLIISIHAPYNLLDYDGPAPQPLRFGRLALNRLGVYPGSLGNYGGLHKQIPVITIELPNAATMPQQREQRQMWEDMLTWMKRTIEPRKKAPIPAVDRK